MTAYRIAAITLEEQGVVTRTRQIEQEREVAISDILDNNLFRPAGSTGGPYNVSLKLGGTRLVFDIKLERDGSPHARLVLPLGAFRDVMRDYFLVCESHYKAIRSAAPQQIEALDMGRRALHDDGARLLQQRLDGRLETDFNTARRLFTLICVLHLKG